MRAGRQARADPASARYYAHAKQFKARQSRTAQAQDDARPGDPRHRSQDRRRRRRPSSDLRPSRWLWRGGFTRRSAASAGRKFSRPGDRASRSKCIGKGKPHRPYEFGVKGLRRHHAQPRQGRPVRRPCQSAARQSLRRPHAGDDHSAGGWSVVSARRSGRSSPMPAIAATTAPLLRNTSSGVYTAGQKRGVTDRDPGRTAPLRPARRAGDRPPQRRSPHGPQLPRPADRRRRQRRTRRRRLQLPTPDQVARLLACLRPGHPRRAQRPRHHAPNLL